MRPAASLLSAVVPLVLGSPVLAAPPEVSDLRFLSRAEIAWATEPLAAGYHLYRGAIPDLRDGYGACLQGSLTGTMAADTVGPAAGEAFFYLAAAFDETGQGPVGFSSAGLPGEPVVPCIAGRRLFELRLPDPSDGASEQEPPRNPGVEIRADARGDVAVILSTGELRVRLGPTEEASFKPISGLKVEMEVVDYQEGGHNDFKHKLPGQQPPLVPPRPPLPGLLTSRVDDGRSGEPVSGDTRAGGGPTYRSRIRYDGPLGQGWDFDANTRLRPSGADVLWLDGAGRAFLFRRTGPSDFASPLGIYAVLRQEPSGAFLLRFPGGLVRRFRPFDGSGTAGALDSDTDLDGDRVAYLYDHHSLLTTIVDHLGRSSTFAYDPLGRITAVTDHASRATTFGYSDDGDLVAVTTPPVTGTPHGNDFPAGKTTRFAYTSGFVDERLNHNLTAITTPNESGGGAPFMTFTHVESGTAFDLDRLDGWTLDIGGVDYTIESHNAGADPTLFDLPRRRTLVVDRNGDQREYLHNVSGHPLQRTEFTNRGLRPGEPDYVTTYRCNADGEILQIDRPAGNRVLLAYDEQGPDRYRQGNLLEARLVADTVSAGGRGDGHGGEVADEVWSFAHEPIGNRLAAVVEPRGNDPSHVPQNGGPTSPARYTTRWTYDYQEGDPALNGIANLAARFGIALGDVALGLGDLNGDGTTLQAAANPVLIEEPAVLLAPASRQAAIEGDTSQESITRLAYNDHGQITRVEDPEGNVHDFEYWPETDPDGDETETPPPDDGRVLDAESGGYLRSMTLDTTAGAGRDNGTDPPPVAGRTDYSYDAGGNLVSVVDGRGVRTTRIHNALDQVVEERRASAVADASGPHADPATGRGEAGLTPLGLRVRYRYDADDNVIAIEAEDPGGGRGVGPFVETTWTYDRLGNPLTRTQEATTRGGLVTVYGYDAGENLVRITFPESNAVDLAYDERGLLLSSTRGAAGARGGVPATRSYAYDGSGALTRLTDGRGGSVDYSYDGLDRLARIVDQVGNVTEMRYDGAGNVIDERRLGSPGGPTPPDRSGAGNVLLEEARYLHDERSRVFEVDRPLFVPAGVTTVRPVSIQEGPLIPRDGAVNRIHEYDALGRRTFVTTDHGATTRFDYDGAGRLLRTTTPDGSATEFTWDAAANLVESVVTEVSQAPGPPDEEFLTTWFHDALGRPTTAVDNLGQTRRAVYDGLDAVIALTDARGPLSGVIVRRSPGHAGLTVPVNQHGNVARYTYDGAGRLTRSETVLTATGQGDGTLTPPPATGDPHNPDGLITLATSWDGNRLPATRTDDNGNTTQYAYDNLDRPTLRTAPDGTITRYTYDAEDNVVEWTDANGTRALILYDPAQNPVQTDLSPAPQVSLSGVGRQFDGRYLVTKTTHTYTPGGSTTSFTVTRAFDSLARTLEDRQGIGGTPDLVADFAWSAEALLAGMTYPSGRRVDYSYDVAGRLARVSDSSRAESAAYEYFGMDRVHTRRYGNGVRSTTLDDAGTADIGYDGARRLALLRHLRSDNSLLAGFEYRHDRDGRRTSHRRLHDQIPSLDAKGETYAYDSAGRLVQWQEGYLDAGHRPVFAFSDTWSWSLDGAGNWAGFTRAGTVFRDAPNNNNEYDEPQSGGTRVDDGVPDDFADPVATMFADGLNQAHDRNGNRTFDGRRGLTYDGFDRLAQAGGAGGTPAGVYAYDALGRRVLRSAMLPGTMTAEDRRYAYAGPSVIEERDGAGLPVREVALAPGGGEPLWQVRGDGSSQYLLEDARGSIVAALSTGSGPVQVHERVTYDPYGLPTFENAANQPLVDPTGRFLSQSTVGNPDLFAGMRYDPELGVRGTTPQNDVAGNYWSGERTYDPNQGRFLTRDMDASWSGSAAGGNGYAVSGSDPVNLAKTPLAGHMIGYRGDHVEGPWHGGGWIPDPASPDPWFDVHLHTIAGRYFDDPVNLFAPRKAYGGPISMIAEALSGPAAPSAGKSGRAHGHLDFLKQVGDPATAKPDRPHGHLDYLKQVGDPATGEPLHQHNQTDLVFLRQRARRSGYETGVDDLEYFVSRVNPAGAVTKVMVRGWDPGSKGAPAGPKEPGTVKIQFPWLPFPGTIPTSYILRVPQGAPGGRGDVIIEYLGQRSNPFPFTIH